MNPKKHNALNIEETGGSFGWKYRLATMTIHQHENGLYYVTDDQKDDRLLSAGHKTIECAVKCNKYQDDYRTRLY